MLEIGFGQLLCKTSNQTRFKAIAAINIPSETFDVEPEALCLDLYPQQIYQTLLLRLREKYNSQP
ncbi:hypothetical protein HZS_7417 [Henneguya salminicola]|nr:hypothetical protein HZS_7417 [Henneguya salminicola]